MVQASSVQIRPATDVDTPSLAAAFTAAFESDPYLQWLCPDPDRYGRLAPAAFGAQLEREYLRRGVVDVAALDELVVGGVMWRIVDPARERRTSLAGARQWLALGGRHARRMVHAYRAFGRLRPPGPHVYLDTIGLVPSAQGRGIASGLLRPCLREADRGGFPVFVESTKLTNLHIYERFGFAPHVLVELPRGPHVWTMVREPRQVALGT